MSHPTAPAGSPAAPADPALLWAAFQQFPTGLLLFDTDLRYLLVNDQMAAMANTPVETMLGRSVHEMFPDYSDLTVRVEEVLATGEPLLGHDVTGRVPGEDVEHVWTLSAYRLVGPDGAVLGVALSSVEVTATRALERERAAMGRRLELLAGAGELLSGGLDSRATVAKVLDLLVPGIATWAAVHLVDPAGGAIVLAGARHRDNAEQRLLDQVLGGFEVTTSQPVGAGHVIATGEADELPHVDDSMLVQLADGSPDSLSGLRSLQVARGVCVPLAARGTTFGALSLSLPAATGGPDTTDLARNASLGDLRSLVDDVAARASLALDNARLYSRQREVAVTLQRSLLPRHLPDVPGIELAPLYLPGAGGTEVGGDFYEAVLRDDGLLFLAIGDVMGHGVRAAAIMGQVRTALRAYALEGHGPVGVLGGLNVTVAALEESAIVTCLVAMLDVSSGVLQLAAAGHPPPAIVTPDSDCRLLPLDPGPPLGVPDAAYAPTEGLLPPGGTLVMFTDGLVEARDQPVGDGLATLCRVLTDAMASDLSPAEVAGRAVSDMGRVDELGRTDATADDVAILVVRRAVGSGSPS